MVAWSEGAALDPMLTFADAEAAMTRVGRNRNGCLWCTLDSKADALRPRRASKRKITSRGVDTDRRPRQDNGDNSTAPGCRAFEGR